jgi:DNA-binding YbaB/EbfC family protein
MFKELGSLGGLMKGARELQAHAKEAQERLARLKVEGRAGGDMVVVEANGQFKITSIKIQPALAQSGDAEMVEELVLAATNQALDRVREATQEEMSKAAAQLDLSGFNDILSKLGLGDPGGPET